VFNATLKIFQLYLAISFIKGGIWSTQRKPHSCRKSLAIFITYCCIEYTSPWPEFELIIIVTDIKGIVVNHITMW